MLSMSKQIDCTPADNIVSLQNDPKTGRYSFVAAIKNPYNDTDTHYYYMWFDKSYGSPEEAKIDADMKGWKVIEPQEFRERFHFGTIDIKDYKIPNEHSEATDASSSNPRRQTKRFIS